jgi:signal peptidase I
VSALLILAALVLASLLLPALALTAAAHLFAFPRRSFPRALLTILALTVVNVLLLLPERLLPGDLRLLAALAAMVFGLLLAWAFVKTFHRTTTPRAWAGVAAIILAQFFLAAVTLLGVRPFLVEAFTLPTLGMAPTLLPAHQLVPCPHCGTPLRIPLPEPRSPGTYSPTCPVCGTQTSIPLEGTTRPTVAPDRFLITKFLAPRRWDVLAHRRRGQVYIQRLIAFPGETLTLTTDGHILIDNTPLTPPPDAPALYPWPTLYPDLHLTLRPDTPLTLGPDQYFVLGDNARASYDSRFQEPVHAADFVGVLSARYWPPSRWALYR